MRFIFLFYIVLGCGNLIYSQFPQDDFSWEEYIEDDFNGSVLNTNLWKVENDYDHYGEVQCYRSQNVSLHNGNLVLRLKYEPYFCQPCDIQNHNFTSGWVELNRLDSNNNPLYFKYGYIEGRFKVPYISNDRLWPAFWTHIGKDLALSPYLITDYSSVNEIDIFEQLAGDYCSRCMINNEPQDDKLLGAGVFLHYNNPFISPYEYARLPYSYANDWHKYAISWAPNEVVWYFDDVPVRSYKNPDNTLYSPYPPYNEGYNNGGLHDFSRLIINLAYQGNDIYSPLDTAMYVDYINIYQLKQDCSQSIDTSFYDFSGYDNKVKNYISLGGVGGSTIFPSSSKTSLKAGQFIELKEGFEVPNDVTVYIGVPGCY